jgi:hypothetical protein
LKIDVTDLDSVLAAITLGDDSAGAYIIDPLPLPKEQRGTQITPVSFGARVFAKGRGNRRVGFTWTVDREHSTASVAGAFAFEHPALVPINAGVVVTFASGSVTYAAAVISSVECVKNAGRTTQFRYTIEGATP